MKIHIQILAWTYILTCAALLAIGSVVLAGLAWHADASAINALMFIGPPIGFVFVIYLVPGLICGIGLLRLSQWALILVLVTSVSQIPLLPFGTALGVYGFWVGLNPETKAIFADSAAAGSGPQFGPLPRWPRSPVLDLLGAMAMVASAFFLILKVGFILHHDPIPAPLDSFGLTVLAVLVLLVGFATVIARIIGNRGKARASGGDPADAEARQRARADARRQAEANFARYDHERRVRVAELAADPERAPYAPLVERGEVWSDENIAYDKDVTLTNTCPHLQAIEAAMRAAGISTKRFREQGAWAKCRIDVGALNRNFAIAPPVRYAEVYAGRPDDNDNPTAYLICDEHASMIHTLHPRETEAMNAPVFPASP